MFQVKLFSRGRHASSTNAESPNEEKEPKTPFVDHRFAARVNRAKESYVDVPAVQITGPGHEAPFAARHRTKSLVSLPVYLGHAHSYAGSPTHSCAPSSTHMNTPPPTVFNPWAVSAHTFTVRKEREFTTTCTVVQPTDAPQRPVHHILAELSCSRMSDVTRRTRTNTNSNSNMNMNVNTNEGRGFVKSGHERILRKQPSLANIEPAWRVEERGVERRLGNPESRRARYEREFQVKEEDRVAFPRSEGSDGVHITLEEDVATDDDFETMQRRKQYLRRMLLWETSRDTLT